MLGRSGMAQQLSVDEESVAVKAIAVAIAIALYANLP